MREVQDLLAAHGEDLSQLNFRGEPVVSVAPTRTSSSSETYGRDSNMAARRFAAWSGRPIATPPDEGLQDLQLRAKLELAIKDHLIHSAGRDAQWRVKFNVSAAELDLLAAATSKLDCAGGDAPWTGKQRFVVTFATDMGEKRLAVFANVTGTQPVVVAIRPIESGQLLTAADVELQYWENAPLAAGRRAPVDSVDAILGMEAARALQAGAVITGDDVHPPVLVKRGEEIAVVARGGGIQVRTLARARQDGARGELIAVESMETREAYNAVVVGVREAVVLSDSPAPVAGVSDQPTFRRPRR
jgi:flagella basal body P-ring formation protein FlgA